MIMAEIVVKSHYVIDKPNTFIPRNQTWDLNILGYSLYCHPSDHGTSRGLVQTPNLKATVTPKITNAGDKSLKGLYVQIKTDQSGVKLVRKINNAEVGIFKKNEIQLQGVALNTRPNINPITDANKLIYNKTRPTVLHQTPVNLIYEKVPDRAEFLADVCQVTTVDDSIAADHSYIIPPKNLTSSFIMRPETPKLGGKSVILNTDTFDLVKLNGFKRTYNGSKVATNSIGVGTDENMFNDFIQERTRLLNSKKENSSVAVQVDETLLNTNELQIFENFVLDQINRQTEMENKMHFRFKMELFEDLKTCSQFDEFGNLPLHTAVLNNDLKLVIRYCTAMKIRRLNVNLCNHDCQTPIQLAIISNANIDILEVLIRRFDADVEVIDTKGNNLLHLGVLYTSPEILELLVTFSNTSTCNATNFDGLTPLILSILEADIEKAEVLLRAGVNPNMGDRKSGRTALFHAVEINNYSLVNLLLDYNAQTKIKNFFGTSPHDAMFELESIDTSIKALILNHKNPKTKYRSRKTKPTEDLVDYESLLKRTRVSLSPTPDS